MKILNKGSLSRAFSHYLLFAGLAFTSCNGQQIGESAIGGNVVPSFLSSYSTSGGNLKVSLTDAPNDDLKSVVVNIKRVYLKAGSHNKKGEFVIANDLGQVDLLTLQDGVLMTMADLTLPAGIRINQIRLELNADGNYIQYQDDSTCDLITPSAQESGLKILTKDFVIKEGRTFSMVADFDAKKSLVFQGNGDCLLKPVLKWGGVSSTGEDDVLGDGSSSGEETDISDGNESTDDSGSDSSDDLNSGSEDTGVDYGSDNDGDGLLDCDSPSFDLYDMSQWPSDFNWDDYQHCF